jgi:hypothetical protein
MSFTKIKNKYAVDLDLEENGKWREFDGFDLKIRRITSKASQDANTEASKKYQKDIQDKTLSDEASEEILNYQICFGILADWRGPDLVDDEGNAIPFSGEKALELLAPEEMKELKGLILTDSINAATYKKVSDEEAVGNSLNSSTGL